MTLIDDLCTAVEDKIQSLAIGVIYVSVQTDETAGQLYVTSYLKSGETIRKNLDTYQLINNSAAYLRGIMQDVSQWDVVLE